MSEIQLPEAFLKLGEVLEQGQFELLFTEEKLRLVYLMNDAVESFLVFENARMTGQTSFFHLFPEGWTLFRKDFSEVSGTVPYSDL